MKKKHFLAAIVLSVLFAGNLPAQDTMAYGYYRYMFPPLECKFMYGDEPYGLLPQNTTPTYFYDKLFCSAPMVAEYIPEEPVVVHGAAITMYHVTDMRAVLWVKRGDTMYFVDSCHWSSQIEQQQHYFLYDNVCEETRPPGYTIVDSAARLYEFYFSQPHIMSDTFYIGFQTLGPDGRPHYGEIDRNLLGMLYLSAYAFRECGSRVDNSVGWMMIFSNESTGLPEDKFYRYAWGGVFPIIELPCDSTISPCPQVDSFGYEVLSPNQVSFSWDTVGEQSDFQISFGPYDKPADSNQWRTTSSNPETYTGMWDEKTYYAAYIRSKCHKQCGPIDTAFWGPWSDPVFFHTGSFMPDTTHHRDTLAAIEGPLPTFSQFTISPNPAHTSVSIALPQMPYGDNSKHLVLIDAAGKEFMRKEFHGDRCTIDISSYPAGVYYVTLFTPLGSATQKLIIGDL